MEIYIEYLNSARKFRIITEFSRQPPHYLTGKYLNIYRTYFNYIGIRNANDKSIATDPTYNPYKPYINLNPHLSASIIYPRMNWNDRIFNSLDPVGPDE